jgi:hypothetical protein
METNFKIIAVDFDGTQNRCCALMNEPHVIRGHMGHF